MEYVYRWHEIYNQQICNLCNELRVPLIDIRSTFLAYRNYSDFLCCDGIHPNAKGHGLLFGVVTVFKGNRPGGLRLTNGQTPPPQPYTNVRLGGIL